MANLRLRNDFVGISNISSPEISAIARKLLDNWPSQIDGQLHLCVGLSGGVDSVALLHLLKSISGYKSLKLSAIHVDHGISPFAWEWREFCRKLCSDWNIPLTVCSGKVTKEGGEGLENSARKFRYKQYAAISANVIILAHHQDDQVETVLSQLMRGSDIHNLSGMLPVMRRGEQLFWRPLLNFSKQELVVYAKENGLCYVQDESNADNRYLRNFLRNQIIPQMAGFDGNVRIRISNSIRSLQQSCTLNDELAQIDLSFCSDIDGIKVEKFLQLSFIRQINMLNYYLRQENISLPTLQQLREFVRQVSTAKPDRHPQLKLSENLVLCRLRNKIIIVRNYSKSSNLSKTALNRLYYT